MTYIRAALFALLSLLAAIPAAAQVNLGSLPQSTIVGRLGISTGPAQAIPFASLLSSLGGTGYTATIASLRAVTGGSAQYIYVGGYTADNDGGEGWFSWNAALSTADNGGTIIAPNSGGGRWVRQRISSNGNEINVKWFGAKGDGSTSDATAVSAAQAVAVAIKGAVYFPASSGCYVTTIRVPDSTSGLRFKGDAHSFGNNSSCITSTDATGTFQVTASASGNTNQIYITDLRITNTANGFGLQVQNTLAWGVNNLEVQATGSGISCDIEGSGNFHWDNSQCYGGSSGTAFKIGNGGGTLTNSGPGTITAGQFSIQGGTGRPIVIEGDPLGVSFVNILYSNSQSAGGTQICSIEIDGPTAGTPVGSVDFFGLHGESNFNFAGTLSDICIGRTNKFGTVNIHGGNSWGSGDSTHFPQYFLRVYNARSVSLRDYTVSKLASAGYAGAAIRLEATFPGASDKYSFTGITADVTGTMYSDANSRCTGTVDCVYDAVRLNTLTLGNPLAPLQGGTGASLTLTQGDLLQASSATAFARLAAVATGNALISGGVGTASSWGKIGLTTHVSGTLPVANGGTNCGAASGTCLDNITGFSTTGLEARTGAGTYAARTVTGTSGQISVSNGDGVSGNPTLSFDQSTALPTYTATLSCGTGSLTSATATGVFEQLSTKGVWFLVNISITTNGTCATRLESLLPFTANRNSSISCVNANSGSANSGLISLALSTTKLLIFTSGSGYPGGDAANISCSGFYERT